MKLFSQVRVCSNNVLAHFDYQSTLIYLMIFKKKSKLVSFVVFSVDTELIEFPAD